MDAESPISPESAAELLRACPSFSRVSVVSLEPISGDASGRQFIRLTLSGGAHSTSILCLHGASRTPGFSGDKAITQEQAFVELAPFLRRHGILAPQVFHHAPAKHAIVLEDVGSQAMWMFAHSRVDEEGERIKDLLGSEWRTELFKRAIDVIACYQAIPRDDSCVAFRRFLSFENYRKEISEFSEYYAAPRGLKPSAAEVLNKVYDAICETLASFPQTLSHFDFNAYNLFVSEQAELRVLDFQDACLVSPARDIVSLINDRGMDETLGRSLHSELLSYYVERLQPGPKFSLWYDITLLHWDFRVSGRYVKLCQAQKTDRYMEWLPGTLRRLGRTLARSYKLIHGLEDVLEIAAALSPEAREGVNDPWS